MAHHHTCCHAHLVLVLQDLMMPEVDGLDILRYVRGNTLLEDLPVISECRVAAYGGCKQGSRGVLTWEVQPGAAKGSAASSGRGAVST